MDSSQLKFSELCERCQEESDLYFRNQSHDPSYCFELFRRAFAKRDERAWEFIYRLYEPLIAGWIISNPAFKNSGEEAGYFINRALEKIWRAIPPEKFERFNNLKAILGYLKMCVGSVIIDHVRRYQRLNLEELNEPQLKEVQAQNPDLEERALKQVHSEELWQEIKQLLSGEQEAYVVYASYVLNLKPSQILTQYPDKFSDVQEIYRLKENILNRFRRNTELIQSLGGHGEEMK